MSAKGNKRELTQKQRLAALLISAGLNQRQAADVVGVKKKQVTRWKRQVAFKEFLAEKMAEVEREVEKARDILIEAAPLAALRMLGLLGSEEEAILLRAASDILDRVGISKTTKVEQDVAIKEFPTVVFNVQRTNEQARDTDEPPRRPGSDIDEHHPLPSHDNGDGGRED